MKINKNSSRLIIFNLPEYYDELSLKNKCEKFGPLSECNIIFKGNKNWWFAFIGYYNI